MNKKFILKMKEINFVKLIVTSALIVSLVAPQFNQIYALNTGNENYQSMESALVLESKAFIEAFPDANFRQTLRDLKVTNKQDNEEISELDFNKTTTLTITNKGIGSLKGIEYFTALTYLNCGTNLLSELNVSNNTKLVELYCSENQLIDLDVSNNKLLKKLMCYKNPIGELDVTNNIYLDTLTCNYNELSELDVSQNKALISLNCHNNPIDNLDLSNNINLDTLMCSSLKLTELDVTNNINLTYLACNINQISSLDIKSNTKLKTLNFSNNQISDIDVSNNTALTSLSFSSNQISDLDISNNLALTSLSCSDNQISDLDISKNTKLGMLTCYNNKLKELNLSNNLSLGMLTFSGNQLTTVDSSNLASSFLMFDASNQVREVDLSKQIDGKYSVYIGTIPNSLDSITELTSGEYKDGYIIWDNLEDVPDKLKYNYNIVKQSKIMDVTLNINKMEEFQVSFESDGGSEVESQTVDSGEQATKPATDPTKEGYVFDGWYEDENLTKTFDFTKPITGDTIIYAKWKRNSGGGGGIIDPPGPSKTVILASGEKYTDVLTATVLGNEKDAPILLAKKDSVDDKTLAEIKRLNTTEIIISGGEDSVSEKVVEQLKLIGYKVTRIAGVDRYETAEKIGIEVRKTGNKEGAMLVDGTNFPDVITISSLASEKRLPILLTQPEDLNITTENAIEDWNINDITIGGSYNSVSKFIEDNLEVNNLNRLGGVDRYETAELIGEEVRKLSGNIDDLILVDGTNFPDGLTINSLSEHFDTPIMLTTPSVLNKIAEKKISDWSIKNILIGGGYNSVSKMIEDNLKVDKKERVAGLDRYETAVEVSERLSDKSTPLGGK